MAGERNPVLLTERALRSLDSQNYGLARELLVAAKEEFRQQTLVTPSARHHDIPAPPTEELQQASLRCTGGWRLVTLNYVPALKHADGRELSADKAKDYLNALEQELRELRQWKEVITDIAVVNWVLSDENAEDAYKMMRDIVAAAIQIQLDPAVSEQAAELRDARAERDSFKQNRDLWWSRHDAVQARLQTMKQALRRYGKQVL